VSHLFTENFNLETTLFSYPAKFVAPIWGKGFECQVGVCGLCCLTELPEDVPRVHNVNFDKAICGLFDIARKKCQKYETRPVGCKTYPFFFGVEEGQVIISTSLECPGTNSKKKVEKGLILDVFKEPYMDERVTFMNNIYEEAILLPRLWNNSNSVWEAIKNRVEDYFSRNSEFPFLQEVTQLIYDTMRDVLGQDAPKIRPFSPPTLIKHTLGLYIATRFESNKLALAEMKGSKIIMVLFNNEIKEICRVKFRVPLEFRFLEMDKGAQDLLHDYVSLLLNRPFMSLAAIKAVFGQIPMPLSLAQALSGAFVPIEAGATLVAYRDKLKRVDREAMREIISFSEGTTYSTFQRPDKVYQY